MRKNFTLLLLSFITFLDVAVLPRACSSTPKDDNIKKEYKQIEEMSGGEAFSIGDGTKDNPFIIENEANLIYFSNSINKGIGNDAYYALNSNIEIRDTFMWVPIGIYYNKGFKGHFNGNGYEISNLKIFSCLREPVDPYDSFYGLFGYNYGIIENLGVTNLVIDLSCDDENICCGGISCINKGMITNCYLSGDINLNRDSEEDRYSPERLYFGGISAINEGMISYNYLNITMSGYLDIERGTNQIYGIANEGLINNCLIIYENNTDFDRIISSELKYDIIAGKRTINCYHYNIDETFSSNNCTSNELNTIDFYTNKLCLDERIWDFGNIIFENGKFLENKYPKIYNKLNDYPDSRNDIDVIKRLKLQFNVSIPDTLVEKYNIYYKSSYQYAVFECNEQEIESIKNQFYYHISDLNNLYLQSFYDKIDEFETNKITDEYIVDLNNENRYLIFIGDVLLIIDDENDILSVCIINDILDNLFYSR